MAILQDLVVCGKSPIDPSAPFTDYHTPCTFNHVMLVVNHLITDLIFLSTFVAVALFIFIGIKLLTSGGNEKAMSDAKSMFFKLVVGYLIILGAWVLVYTVTNALLQPVYSQLLGKPKPI